MQLIFPMLQLTKAKEKAEKKNIKNIFFYVMNAEKLDFEDNYFHVIFGSAIRPPFRSKYCIF